LLAAARADLNAVDNDGHSVFYLAAVNGNAPLVEYLISQGVDPNARSEYGETSLHMAVASASLTPEQLLTAVKLIVRAGVDVNAVDRAGRTALHILADWGGVEVADYLLSHSADPNIRDTHSRTPLLACAKSRYQPHERQLAMAKSLVMAGADAHAGDEYGNPALTWAALQGNEELAEFLCSLGKEAAGDE
jgi:ankyrin repeat protein